MQFTAVPAMPAGGVTWLTLRGPARGPAPKRARASAVRAVLL